jgi:hypothetical protein
MRSLRQRFLACSALAAMVLAATLVASGVHEHADGSDSPACAVCVAGKHAPAVAAPTAMPPEIIVSSERPALAPVYRPIRSARRPYAERAPPHLSA